MSDAFELGFLGMFFKTYVDTLVITMHIISDLVVVVTYLCRREKIFADEVEFLDFDDHLTPPSELYAGTGGKPLLPFHLDTKTHRKK